MNYQKIGYFAVGIVTGATLVVSQPLQADTALKQVTAYLRPDLPILVDGERLNLNNSPLIYDGSTYLPLRETATTLGKTVNWNEATQSVELTSAAVSAPPTVSPSPKPSATPAPSTPTATTKSKLDHKINETYTFNREGSTITVYDLKRENGQVSIKVKINLSNSQRILKDKPVLWYRFFSTNQTENDAIKKEIVRFPPLESGGEYIFELSKAVGDPSAIYRVMLGSDSYLMLQAAYFYFD